MVFIVSLIAILRKDLSWKKLLSVNEVELLAVIEIKLLAVNEVEMLENIAIDQQKTTNLILNGYITIFVIGFHQKLQIPLAIADSAYICEIMTVNNAHLMFCVWIPQTVPKSANLDADSA